MPRLDVDALLAQRGRWEIRIAGRAYIARPVSAEAVDRFYERMRESTEAATQARLVEALLRLAFPRRVHYAWRPDRDPVRLILGLDAASRNAVLASFFAFQRGETARVPLTLSTPAST